MQNLDVFVAKKVRENQVEKWSRDFPSTLKVNLS
jgi:hypothetical protein